MSSSISSSSDHRRFATWLLGLVLLPVALLFGLSAQLQPLYGDLTRVGSFAENDFGWNRPQLEFRRPLYASGPYDRYYDIVVLGDSFSTERPAQQWQNHLVATTGWSVLTLDINKTSVAEILGNPVYRKTPPRFFILETVEREVPRRLKSEPFCDAKALAAPDPVAALAPPPVRAGRAETVSERMLVPVRRETAWHDVKLGYVRDYLWKGLQRRLLGQARGNVEKVELAGDAPFSSTTRNAMLVFGNDLRKAQWWREMGLPQIRCRIARTREQVEANGHTRFVFMAAPDKLTVYGGFVRDQELRKLSALAELSAELSAFTPRLDLALASAIRRGEEDVYLPDDTHWGSSGHRLAAETLLDFLQQP